jgi:hypothetical protein
MSKDAVTGSVLIRDAGTIMTGTVICAAVIAAGVGNTASIAALSVAIVFTVAFTWLTQLYCAAMAGAIARREHPWRAARQAIASSWLLAAASLLPLGILVVAGHLGADLRSASTTALVATIGLLAAYGAIAGYRGGLRTRGVVLCATGGAALGLLIVVAKALL